MSGNSTTSRPFRVGDRITVEIGSVAHGGHFIAHHLDQTLFVRGVLEGEQAIIEITAFRKKIYEARAVEILQASPMRVTPPCVSSGYCGGCDFQHVQLPHQRTLKTQVLVSALQKFTGMSHSEISKVLGPGVREIPGYGHDGRNWRTRARFVWQDGWHMHQHRSHRLTPTPECVVITPGMRKSLNSIDPAAQEEDVLVAEGDNGVSVVGSKSGSHGRSRVEHTDFGVTWQLKPESFWQAHPGIIGQITDFLDSLKLVHEGQMWWDLYSGSGVLSAYLGNRVTDSGSVVAVEGSTVATQSAKRALHERPHIRVINHDVAGFLNSSLHSDQFISPDGIVLDPPRAGAGKEVCDRLLEIGSPYIVYVACDPVSLSRDLKYLTRDYTLTNLAAWDAFPMSHHFESVVVLARNLI
jgi:tRNA/tmRNA/rRNA uracil-C5-methylase (TrmA/RlmC/RlmD family)